MKCKAGEFLNQTLGTCVPCAAGEFSLGNAIRYEFSAEAKKRYQQQLQNSDGSNSGESSQASDVWKSITLSEFSRNGFPDNDMPRDKSDFSAYIKKKAKCSTYDSTHWKILSIFISFTWVRLLSEFSGTSPKPAISRCAPFRAAWRASPSQWSLNAPGTFASNTSTADHHHYSVSKCVAS